MRGELPNNQFEGRLPDKPLNGFGQWPLQGDQFGLSTHDVTARDRT